MKGVFIERQLEFRLEAAAPEEGCRQGDGLSCALSIKNHAAAPQTPGRLRLILAYGDAKKAKAKAADAFELAAEAALEPCDEIPPQASRRREWRFELDRNCLISDKQRSPYLLYGAGDAVTALEQLPLTVLPHPHIAAVLTTLEASFSFVLKGLKSSGGRVTAKFAPPASPRFALLESLTLACRFEAEALDLKYVFGVKKIEGGVVKVGVRKAKREFEQQLEPGRYLMTGGFLDHQAIDAAVGEALGVVSTGL